MNKVFIFASVLLPSSISLADKIDDLQKIVAIQQAEINGIRQSLQPVGSIIQSLLDEKTFKSEYGSRWRIMHGSLNVEGTKLCTLMRKGDSQSNCLLADASGLFFRNTGGHGGPVGGLQEASVLLPELKVDLSHTHQNVQFGVYTSGTSNTFNGVSGNMPGGLLGGPGGTIYGSTDVKSIGFQGGAVVSRGDSLMPNETRPRNMSVNVFIKVDE